MDCGRSKVLIKRCACMHSWIMGCALYHEQLFELLKGQNRCRIEGRRYLSLFRHLREPRRDACAKHLTL